ncbi:A disintegrin and metalloproteinase with thrombospondin motifs 19-like [Actinia tenebrosa]|uniref:A disintegrin and metalloproteinase with thrombospondin motifs 19-like n=1 Tax=Actinia tenebrosa TaxID=6105 RepID=A0A6P8I800_ACTTE|nr:A disintegrin and metalloproteinase with thrombospondin motifs 19-like [Actinia tenebrosa]
MCSHRCGNGNRTRRVPCVQQVAQFTYSEVESRHCNASIRPHRSEPCNQIACGAAWAVDHWSECVLVNGSLIATRTVRCQNILGNGTVINADPKECTEVDNIILKSVKNCTFTTTSTSPTTAKGPDVETSIGIWLPITVVASIIAAFLIFLFIFILYRTGYLACHYKRGKASFEGLKLEHAESVEA